MERNRSLALNAREKLCRALAVEPPCPDEMVGTLATIPLPEDPASAAPAPLPVDPLTNVLFERFGIEVVVFLLQPGPRRLLRVSAQIYNSPEQYDRLVGALREVL